MSLKVLKSVSVPIVFSRGGGRSFGRVFPLDGCTPLTVYRTPAGKSQLHLKRYNPRTAVLQHIGKYR
jgi:hypothetical protein